MLTSDQSVSAAGYESYAYAGSFAEFGSPLVLPRAGGWLIKRAIGKSGFADAMGCYPLFCCREWDALPEDLDALRGELVSAVLVTDPFAAVDARVLQSFDHARPYKDHFVIETGSPPASFVSRSHRIQAARALRKVTVEICPEPSRYLDEWERLFAVLARRHSISGVKRFSRRAFEEQLSAPGMVMFRAAVGGGTVGLDLWYRQGDVAHGHLAAFDQTGYDLRASYATKWTMIEYFNDKVKLINLGAGSSMDATDGLAQFKRGFSNASRQAWICGRILQPAAYEALARQAGRNQADGYFPTYRVGEFS